MRASVVMTTDTTAAPRHSVSSTSLPSSFEIASGGDPTDGCADLAVHGHAHSGTERGLTSGGVKVRNVAQPLIRRAYALFHFAQDDPSAAPRNALQDVTHLPAT